MCRRLVHTSSAASELALPDPAAAFAALEAWLETLSGANPLEHGRVRGGPRRGPADRARTGAGRRSGPSEARATIAELEREIEQLESGVHPTPPVPYTRGADAREQRAGAPLWQLVDFRDDVAPDDRAGIEAALEAAGILDGWVTPSGELLDPDTEDVLLAAGARLAAGRASRTRLCRRSATPPGCRRPTCTGCSRRSGSARATQPCG